MASHPPARATWGRRIEDVVGKTAGEIFPGSNAGGTFLAVVEEIMATGQPKHWELALAGTGQVLRMVSIPMGGHVVSTGLDVTMERTRQRERVHALIGVTQAARAGGVGLRDWDLRTNEVHCSDAWKRELGCTRTARTAGIAHDFNNLLMAVTGNLSLVRHTPLIAPETPALLKALRGKVKHCEPGRTAPKGRAGADSPVSC
jgi:hypothetical protein